jgi:ketosteroid isomerase-like protein
MKLMLSLTAAVAFVAAATSAISQHSSPSAPPLRAGVETHLAAVAARDMNALLPTLTSGSELTMIAPNGHKLDTRQQYVDFHRQWFAAKDGGRLETEIVRLVESPSLGHALIRSRYRFTGQGGRTQTSATWLALTFALEEGKWRLVFDQNTMIDTAAVR